MRPPRILIADDHEMIRRGIRATIEARELGDIVAEADNGRAAVAEAIRTRPDLVLMDISMPQLNGLEATIQIHAVLPDVRILVLSMLEDEDIVRSILEAGAQGYLLKSDAGHELVRAVEALMEDRPYFTSKVARMVLDGYRQHATLGAAPASGLETLTEREREIVQLLAEGRSTKEVAAILGMAYKTAETHRTNLMRKAGLHSVADLVRYAIRNHIIEP